MSEFIAFLSKDGVEFFDKDLNRVECDNPEKHTIYAVLPDEYFFFFQSDITSKRRAYLTIEAYAKSIFPIENGFVGYMSDFLPLIGYICFFNKIPEKFIEIVKEAKVVTTPFAIYLQSYAKNRFVYEGESVCAAYLDSKLKYYTTGDGCPVVEDYIPDNAEKIEYSKEECLKKLWTFASLNALHKVNLPVSRDAAGGFEGWKLYRFALLALAALIFIAGGIFRYSYYKKELSKIDSKIEAVYKKALGNKHYSDPYGVLLYKAQYANGGGYDIDPMNLLYAISKAKGNFNIKINYLAFSKGGVKIIGEIDNYASLVGYVDKINAILSKKFVIQNTSSKKGKLLFTLLYGNGEEG